MSLVAQRLTSLKLLRTLRGLVLCVFEKPGATEIGGTGGEEIQRSGLFCSVGAEVS
jgi:hypothetical protein